MMPETIMQKFVLHAFLPGDAYCSTYRPEKRTGFSEEPDFFHPIQLQNVPIENI